MSKQTTRIYRFASTNDKAAPVILVEAATEAEAYRRLAQSLWTADVPSALEVARDVGNGATVMEKERT